MRTRDILIRVTALLALLLTIFASPAHPALAADPVVSLVPAAPSMDVGQTVIVSVTIDGVTNLFGAEFHLEFDPSILQVVDADSGAADIQITPGTFLSPDFIVQNQANNAVGTIDFAVSQMAPNAPVSGSGTLATITFEGSAAGTSAVTFTSVTLSDNGGGQITGSAQNGSVTVNSIAPTATATTEPTATEEAPTETPSPTPTGTVTSPVETPTATEPAPTATSTTPAPTATGTTPAPTATTAPSSCSFQGYHVVKAGETLYSIGRAYATRPLNIASCNGIVNPSLIYVGMKLGIPVAPWSPVPAGPVATRQFDPGGNVPTPPPTSTPAPSTCRFYHTVQRGDTLTAIAIRYGSNIWAIGRANNIYNLNLIFPGQVLCIP